MPASPGDRIVIQSKVDGQPDKIGEIIEAKGPNGNPPYLVRFDDGHESLINPGPNDVVRTPE